jgi:hypothetical protein
MHDVDFAPLARGAEAFARADDAGVRLNLIFETTQIVRKGGRRVRAALRRNRLDRVWRPYRLPRLRFHPQSCYASSARKSI